MYNNKVSIKINCYKGFNYEQTFSGVKKAGFKYVELSTSKGNSCNLLQDIPFNELVKMKLDLETRGLVPITIGGNSFLLDDDKSRVLNNIYLGKFFGCKYLDATVCDAHAETDKEYSDEEVIEKINYYVPYLEENDLDLVIELHGSFASGEKLENIIKGVNSNHVHINYDTGNALYWGKLEVEEMVEDFKKHVDLVSFMHIKDKLGTKESWNFPAIGSGYIPFEEIFKTLKQNNNDAMLTCEIEFTDKGVSDVNEVDKALVDSANYLRSLGFDLEK